MLGLAGTVMMGDGGQSGEQKQRLAVSIPVQAEGQCRPQASVQERCLYIPRVEVKAEPASLMLPSI